MTPVPPEPPGPPEGLFPVEPEKRPGWRRPLLENHPWIVFLLPFVVFGVITALEPTESTPGGGMIGLAIPYAYYPLVYTIKIALTTAAVIFVLPGYRTFPFRLSPLALLVGVVGAALWIGICELRLEERLFPAIGLESFRELGQRSGYNPLVRFAGQPLVAWGFLAVRLFGLVVVISVIEEFFLRGFLMRFVVDADWANVPFGKVDRWAAIVGTAVPMLMHPGELFAAAVWFSLVTWLMVRNKNIWDCVAAHVTTNLALGLFVVIEGHHWHLM